ncbi:hypothetical protein CDV31_003470 [Fusarium ambrosium]|uniref:Uncharacterized protein n=1 Tax=Fusarium ambrosium TaxID=131363 RepID=A0A428UTW0_9HYPO|nr:hypothetical protein CDV31_003470 [Fusarium ambrosium]
MSSPTRSPNTDPSGSEEQNDVKLCMLNRFIYDTSPLPDRLFIAAMSATTHKSSSAATETTTAAKDKPSDCFFVKDLEGAQKTTAKL